MPFIEVIPQESAEGELKEIYAELVEKRGKLAAIHQIQSLNPKTIMAHMDLYMKIMFGKSPLRRYQREMIAVVVSATNECDYCVTHHANALIHFWKDEMKVLQLKLDYTKVHLADVDTLLCELAEKLTLYPNFENKVEQLADLKKAGLDDRAILDATLVIAYFNFVNRVVLGLGVNIESDGGTGYKYE